MLEAIVKRLPAPKGDETAPLKALLVDSWYDAYLGVVVLVRVIDGSLSKKGQKIKMMGTDAHYEVDRHRRLHAEDEGRGRARAGRDGLHHRADQAGGRHPRRRHDHRRAPRPAPRRCPASSLRSPSVFCGLFPVDAADFEDLRAAMGRLRLNDASFSYEMESSAALGFGFRCGFLGLLHLEIIQERLEREFNLDLIATAPSVVYRLKLRDGTRPSCTTPPTCQTPPRSSRSRSRGSVPRSSRPTITSARAEALPGSARRAGGSELCRQARDGDL